MKKSVILVVCFGFAACFSACNESKSFGNICDKLSDGTKMCFDNAVVTCKGNDIESTMPCSGTCSKGVCVSDTACNYQGSKCGADGNSSSTCENSVESINPCSCGCDVATGVCKMCEVQCNCETKEGCTTEELAKCPDANSCTGNQTKCVFENGIYTEYTCMIMGADGVHGTWANNGDCEFGCNGDKCAESAGAGCDYQGSKCGADGNSSSTCENSVESINPCSCGCDVATGVCKMCEVQCNCKTKEGCTAEELAKCQVTPETCNCETGANCTEDELDACLFDEDYCIDVDGYEVDNGANGCSSEFVVSKCVDGVWDSKVQDCPSDAFCWDGVCYSEDASDECIGIEGKTCLADSVILCDKNGEFELVESCIEGCTDGVCDDVACPAKAIPSCFDPKTILACDTSSNKMAKTSCPEGQLCVSGECYNADQESSCNFESMCTTDHSSIKKCVDGKIVFNPCDVKKYCDDTEDTPKCVSAMISEDLGLCDEEHFVSACKSDREAYTCDAGSLKVTHCNKNETCVSGICRTTTNKKIGDSCNPEYFDDTCINNTPVTCNKSSKRITIIENEENCTQTNSVCGAVESGGIQLFSCFEPCSEKGSSIDRCIGTSGDAYQTTMTCVDLGNGTLGYDYVSASYQTCDKGCRNGKCVDYTDGVDDVGQACEMGKYEGFCKDNSTAVACDSDGENNEIVQVEICDYNEICMTYRAYSTDEKDTAVCVRQCNSGDEKIHVCSPYFNLDYSKEYECRGQDGKYGYVPTGESEICSNGCAADGTCVK